MTGAPTRLLVDARPIDHPTSRQRGIGHYVAGLIDGLLTIGAPTTVLVESTAAAAHLPPTVAAEHVEILRPDVVSRHAEAGAWFVATGLFLHPISLDPIPAIVTEARLPVAGIMYDVIPYRHPQRYLMVEAAARQARLRAPLARSVDATLAISRFSASTAIEELGLDPNRVRVIGAGVDRRFIPATGARADAAPRVLAGIDGRYVVAVTGGDERKNTEGLLRAWGRLPAAVRASTTLLVIAEHVPAVLHRWLGWAWEAGVAGEVVFTGAVTDDEMVGLLQHAALAVMPSVEEGFGLPVVEAAACACPVICSGVSSLPEVLEDPAACFDPHDPADMARLIEQALVDPDLRRTLRVAGDWAVARWTWERVATDLCGALDELGPLRPWVAPRRLGPRVAVVAPSPTSPSGIGSYTASVVAALATVTEAAGVEVSAGIDTSGTAERAPFDRSRFPAAAFGRYVKPHEFDHVVTVLGSSHFHCATLRAATAHPTHVWLHEATLVGAVIGLGHRSGSQRWAIEHARDAVSRSEAADMVRTLEEAGPAAVLDAEQLHRRGVRLLAPALERARSVVVSSERAASIVGEAAARLGIAAPPTLVLPLAYPPPSARREGGPGDPATIVAAGWIATNKQPERAVEVAARVTCSVPCRLVFAGGAVGDAADRIAATADRLGISDQVEVLGRLDQGAFDELMARVDLGLVLRVAENGEMSAVISDLQAHGVPVVTTLSTAPDAGEGLVVVAADSDLDAVVDACRDLLADAERWRAASAASRQRATSWTHADVAAALWRWLDGGHRCPGVTVAGPGR